MPNKPHAIDRRTLLLAGGLALAGRPARALPDVPTMAESGITDVVGSSWIGIVAPAGTPKVIVARLHDEIVSGVRSPAVGDKLKMLAAEPREMSPEQFGAFIASEYGRIGAIFRAAGIQAQ
jgi:tripartite-type tricarboxylate transporter receptor subunit TctC